MDGAIPAFGADSVRRLTARFNLSSGAGSAHSLQSGLFEQLLSAPPPSRMDRQSFSYNAGDASSSIDTLSEHDRDRGASSATQRSDRDEREDVRPDDGDDELSEPSAATAQATVLPAPPAAAPLLVGEDAAADVSEVATAGDGAAEDAGDSKTGNVETGESRLEESSAESPSIDSEYAKSPPQDAVEGGAAGIDSLGSAARVQAGVRVGTASGSSTDAASSETETQVQTAQTLPLPATDDAVALDPSSSAAEEGLSPAELGDERLTQPRSEASDEESAAATGERSQVGGQAEVTSTNDGNSRDNRREKWFQREAGDSSTARGESNTASNAPAARAGIAAGNLSAGVASAQSGAMAEGTVNGSLAGENAAAQTLPDSLPQVQPSAVTAATMGIEPRLAALENAAGGGLGGERQSAQGNTVDGIETTQRQSSAQRADAKPGAQDAQRPDVLTQAERVRLVQRVSRSFARLGPMGGQISLKLHPPQLGALNVQVRMEGRSMTAKLTTESGAARDAIMESLPVLRKRLAEQGFEISSFQVEVADTQSDVSNSDNSRSGSDLAGGRDNRQTAGQGTDYRRLAAQQRQPSDRYDVAPSSVVASGGAAWELPRGVDVEA